MIGIVIPFYFIPCNTHLYSQPGCTVNIFMINPTVFLFKAVSVGLCLDFLFLSIFYGDLFSGMLGY